MTYDDATGVLPTQSRLDDMDLNWVEASLCSHVPASGQTFLGKRELSRPVRARNDWIVGGWCAGSGGRLLPLCLIPLWDPALAAAEVRRNAARGVRAVCFSELPGNLGLPSVHDADRHWDPFVAACDETGTVICMHSGSGAKLPSTSPDQPPAGSSTRTRELAEGCSPTARFKRLVRYPNVTLTYWRARSVGSRTTRRLRWEHNRGWADARDLVPEPPSTYYWGRIYGCFFDDAAGLAAIDAIGPDQVTFETDYPHADGTWPHSKAVAEKLLDGLGDDLVHKIVRGNALRMLGIA